jgi:hypothetical protein
VSALQAEIDMRLLLFPLIERTLQGVCFSDDLLVCCAKHVDLEWGVVVSALQAEELIRS